MVALDISKAFDAVDHTLLLQQLSESDINSNVVRWLAAYLRGRSASCLFQSRKSPSMIIHSGVPQGSVLSPSLFNFFISDFPLQASITSSYADDFHVGESSPDLSLLTSALSEDLRQIESWADEKNLSIASNKSSITLFTPDPAQAQFKGDVIPINKYPKILGITLDTKLTFSHHIEDIKTRLSRRLQILKALAGTSWGQCKETLLLTYKSLIRSLINYGCPLWYPNVSETFIKKLQVIQNSALRTVTGCHMKSPIEHLHTEAGELKVKTTLNSSPPST